MSASVGADPAELDVLAATLHELAARQRLAVRRFEVAVEAARRAHRPLAISGVASLRSLRSIVDAHEHLAADAARTAERLRSADRVLMALAGGGRAASEGGQKLDPLPDPADDLGRRWRWPPDLGLEWSWAGDRFSAAAEIGAGIHATAGAGLDVIDGVLAIGAHVDTKVGGWARAAAASAIGPLGVRAAAEAFVGADAHANATVGVGRNGARADLGAGAFLGAKAKGEVGADLGPVGITAGAEARYGIGADVDLTASVTWEHIELRFDFGVAYGLGAGVSSGVTLHPRDLFDGVVDLGDDAVRITQDVWDTGRAAAAGGLDVATDALGAGLAAGKDFLGDTLGSATRTVGRWLP